MKAIGTLLLTLACSGACAGPAAVQGGHAVFAASPGLESGRLVHRYRVASCVDKSGASVANRYSAIDWRQGEANEQLLEVEFLPGATGAERLILDNSFALGTERVFQVVLSSPEKPQLLMDVRLPVQGGAGRLALVRSWQQKEVGEQRFRAYFSELAAACWLEQLPSPGTLDGLGSKLSQRLQAGPQTG